MRVRKITEQALGLQPDVVERFEQQCEASIRSFAHPYMGPISHGGGAVTRRERAGASSLFSESENHDAHSFGFIIPRPVAKTPAPDIPILARCQTTVISRDAGAVIPTDVP